jgi:hypothetical protein
MKRLNVPALPTSDVLLFDSGRFPFWFRVPALVFGLLLAWLAAAIAAYSLFGVRLGIPMSDVRGSPFLGSLACLAIAAIWIFIWFAQLQILFDSTRQELIVRTRGYFRSHDRRVSLVGSREIYMRRGPRGFASRTWNVSINFSDGRSEHVTSIPSGIELLAESLEAATNLPIRRYDKPA